MRYHLDTIPVWDAVKLEGECPLCALRRHNELIDVERYLGASVMEPETRIQVNAQGFCPRHQVLLYQQQNRLGHALMMHTHLKETMTKLAPVMEGAKKGKPPKRGLLRRSREEGEDALSAAVREIREMTGTCILCRSIEENTNRYAYTLLHLYQTDSSFRKAFRESKGVCLPDLALLMEMAREEMRGDTLKEFIADLCSITEKSLNKLEGDLEGFTLKFDYRNADKPWGDSRGSLERTVNKLRGWCLGQEPWPQ